AGSIGGRCKWAGAWRPRRNRVHRRAVAVAAAAATLIASTAKAQTTDSLSRAFDRMDQEALLVMEHLRCSSGTFNAWKAGVIAEPDSGTHILCARVGG